MIDKTKNSNVGVQSNTIVMNKEFFYKKKHLERVMPLIICILYAVFFALLPSLYIFSNIYQGKNEYVFNEQIMIFILLFIGVFSIYAINWIYQGSYKRIFTKNIYTSHLINSIMLVAIVIIFSLPFLSVNIQSGKETNWTEFISNRSFYYFIAVVVWFVVFSLELGISVNKTKKMFSVPWFKYKINLFSSIFFVGAVFLSFMLAKEAQLGSASGELNIIFISLIAALLAFDVLFIIFSHIYTKLFKENLLANKTEQEMDLIENSRKLSVLLKVSIAAIILFFGASMIFAASSAVNVSINYIYLGTNVGIDAIIIIVFLAIVYTQKKATLKNKKLVKKTAISSLDLSLLVKIVVWAIFTKLFLILLFLFAAQVPQGQSTWLLFSSSIAVLIIYFLCWAFNINFPNVKATPSLITHLLVFIILFVSVILIYSWYKAYQFDDNIDYIAAFLIAVVLVGSSVELFLSIFLTKRLYDAKKQETILEEQDEFSKIKKNSKFKTVETSVRDF